jgi:polyisoprenyl-phosphate glycosyltransferase
VNHYHKALNNYKIVQVSLIKIMINFVKRKISVVIPVFNEEEVISDTISTLLKETSTWKYNYELIFINDGSIDRTYDILKDKCALNTNIKVLNLSRNFGHQMAFTAGLDIASGDAVIVIDGDLQDPPHVMKQFITKWENGFHVVYGKRSRRKGETYFKKLSARLFYQLLDVLSETNIPRDTGDFRLMDRCVVEKLKTMREKHRFIRGMVSWVGFKQTSVIYERDQRPAGKTKYPFKKMMTFALDGIFSFSTVPIKISLFVGFLTILVSFFGILLALINRLLTNGWVSGWTTLIITILFLGGVQLISIGVLGQYIGRTFEQIKDRPLYIIQDTTNLDE